MTPINEVLIQEIESLFPIDSEFEDTRTVGKKLLLEAIEEVNWRNLPESYLKLYKQKCLDMERYQTNYKTKN